MVVSISDVQASCTTTTAENHRRVCDTGTSTAVGRSLDSVNESAMPAAVATAWAQTTLETATRVDA